MNGTQHFDEPTVLWIFLSKINPSVRVGRNYLKTNLENATISMYKHNDVALLDYMYKQYTEIYDKHSTQEDYTLNLFTDLRTAHKDKFLSCIATLQDNWETSTANYTDPEISEDLCTKTIQKYNNMNLTGPPSTNFTNFT